MKPLMELTDTADSTLFTLKNKFVSIHTSFHAEKPIGNVIVIKGKLLMYLVSSSHEWIVRVAPSTKVTQRRKK